MVSLTGFSLFCNALTGLIVAEPMGLKNHLKRFAFPRRYWRRGLVFMLALSFTGLLGLWLAVRFLPFDDTKLRNLDVSTVVTDRDGRFLRSYLSDDQRWRIPAKLSTVSPWMAKATIAAEDRRFYEHHGIDYMAIGRAMVANTKAGRIVSGASTISMQVAGFIVESRERTLFRKLRQAFLALQLEQHWTKQEILECYFTHASYGGNVCGVEAAARRYFNKTGAELSSGEAALLAGIPQSPERFRPDRHLKAAVERRAYVLQRMFELGDLSENDYLRVSKIKVHTGTYAVPVSAPHYCDVVTNMYPDKKRLHTTLKLDIQRQAERFLEEAVRKNRGAGVSNGAVVVLDNKSAEVLAMVGSVDYWNRFDRGEVNGALGFRSPGSALKPLIFGQAMDDGLLEPDEILYDVPITISGYSPVNYDRQFRGPVPASKALAWSLNIPAIEVMRRVGVGEFRDSLQDNGVQVKINPVGDQGLSLAIGTCSVRLLDLAMAYSSLACQGQIKRPVWTKETSVRGMDTHRWLSPESCAVLLNVLSDETVRAPEDVDVQLTGLKGVAWKTGTSNGFRDAWTMAVTENYTIGVWMGNMNGQPSRALVGGKTAAPVALGLARMLDRGNVLKNVNMADSITWETACLQTGLIAGDNCSDKVTCRFIKGKSYKSCGVHLSVAVDRETGYCLCARCQTGHSWDSKNCAFYPAEVASWFRSSGHPWVEGLPPAHNPDCGESRLGEPPTIITPIAGSEIVFLENLPEDFQKITLSARSDDPASQLFWFVDGVLAGRASAYDSVRINPVIGKHKVRCVDMRGRSSETWFTVESSSKLEKIASSD